MKRVTYDVALKMKLINEYASGSESYRILANKYQIPIATVASWMLKAKKRGSLPDLRLPKGEFINITAEVEHPTKEALSSLVSIQINNLTIKSDIATLIRLIKGAEDVPN